MSVSPSTPSADTGRDRSRYPIHHEQRRIGHICAILVRNLSLRPTRDRALQTLTSKRPGGSNRYHTTSDDADLTLSLARSNSKGKTKADGSHCRRRSASWSRHGAGSSDDDDEQEHERDASSASTSTPTKSHFIDRRNDRRGRSAFLANHRRTSDHELTTSSSLSSSADGIHGIDASPRPILKRSSSTRDGRDARLQSGSPGGTSASGSLDELGANTTMLSRSDSRSSSHSSHTIRRPSHRARTTSMTSSTSVRSVRFDESHVGAAEESRRPSRITGRLNAVSRYLLFSQKSLAQIMKDRMLECYVELSLHPDEDAFGKGSTSADANGTSKKDVGSTTTGEIESIFYRTPNSKPGLHHSWGYQGGDPITPERDFALREDSALTTPLEGSTFRIKVWARSPPTEAKESGMQAAASTSKAEEEAWKLVCQTSVDLRNLEPLPGNLLDAIPSLPPNSILLGLAPGANSLSGRASLASSDSQAALEGPPSEDAKKGPKLTRQGSEREAERTRHILESIIYYAVPLESAHQGGASKEDTDKPSQVSGKLNTADANMKQTRGENSLSKSPTLRRRASVEGYASDPENAPNRRVTPEQGAESLSPISNATALSTAATAVTPDARRRERRKAFEDEQRRVLELSLRETKMMPSYSLDEARHLAKKQTELHDLLAEVDGLRQEDGNLLQDPEGFVQLRLKREQQKARSEAARQSAIDEADDLKRRRDELQGRKAALEARKNAIKASKSLFEAAEDRSRRLGDQVHALRAEKVDLALDVHAQQASLLRDLEMIFPIELSDASSLLFSICGLPLPNAVASLPQMELAQEEKRWKDTVKRHVPPSTRPVFHPFDDDTVSSAFGLVAQLVVLLSTYLATPIHYPLATAGSRAVVQDGISLMSGPRAFPLYGKGMERYRYEYAAFLLNKDIEQLMNVHSVTVIDIRHTLPNLKNLMVTVAAAPPTSQLTRKSHIGKTEISLRSAASSMSLSRQAEEDAGVGESGSAKRPGTGLGLGLPNLNTITGQGSKSEAMPDNLMTTRVLGAPSKPTATPATASGAIASVSRAFSYFSGSTR
ncbi:uncharacterized protein UTRI_03731_B [Ustilago trichophora]|uniref:Autophagy-related protein 14 n=1 Tax=Ustilago trichophora TaxID=86804 RepID=A0A5C3E2S8_9BASI|nr:uncharacterized protein UTRI_03731_B [Ustilago trichophora]